MSFAGLPACFQNLDELVSKLRSTVTVGKDAINKHADSGTTQDNAAGSTRQEAMPDYGAADDEFPQGTITASFRASRLMQGCNTFTVSLSCKPKAHAAKSCAQCAGDRLPKMLLKVLGDCVPGHPISKLLPNDCSLMAAPQ